MRIRRTFHVPTIVQVIGCVSLITWALVHVTLSTAHRPGVFWNEGFAAEHLRGAEVEPSRKQRSIVHDVALDGASHDSRKRNLEAAQLSKPGRINFLFLLTSTIVHLSIWQTFFTQAPAKSWTAWAHCVDKKSCSFADMKASIPGLKKVATVPTLRCIDLVSAEVALIRAALKVPAKTGIIDKYVFVSESTLPIKPYAFIFHALVDHDESDFCMQSNHKWLTQYLQYPEEGIYNLTCGAHEAKICRECGQKKVMCHGDCWWNGTDCLRWHRRSTWDGQTAVSLVKSSQFVVLNRADATILERDWYITDKGEWYARMTSKRWKQGVFPLKQAQGPIQSVYSWLVDNPAFKWSYPSGTCADEFAIFGVVHGAVEKGEFGLPSCPLNRSTSCSTFNELLAQSRCPTFSVNGKGNNSLLYGLRNDPDTKIERGGNKKSGHGLVIRRLGMRSMKLLAESEYLFVRKFYPGMDLSGFAETVLQASSVDEANQVKT